MFQRTKNFLKNYTINLGVKPLLYNILKVTELKEVKKILTEQLNSPYITYYEFTIHQGVFFSCMLYNKRTDEYLKKLKGQEHSLAIEDIYYDTLDVEDMITRTDRRLPVVISEAPFYFPVPILKGIWGCNIFHRFDTNGNLIIAISTGRFEHGFSDKDEEIQAIQNIKNRSVILFKANLFDLYANLGNINFFDHTKHFEVKDLSGEIDYGEGHEEQHSGYYNIFGERCFNLSNSGSIGNEYFDLSVSRNFEDE
jgi:hypothetical protein